MPINPDAVGATSEPVERSWDSKDALLYAVGVGAGTGELPFTTENSKGIQQQVLPTFAVIAGAGGAAMAAAGDIDWTQLVHGEQAFELAGPIPVSGTARTTSTITGIYDKGKGAVIAIRDRSNVQMKNLGPVEALQGRRRARELQKSFSSSVSMPRSSS